MRKETARFWMLLAVALAVTARTLQLQLFYDPAAGFTTDGGWLSGVVLGLAAVAVFLPFIRTEGREIVFSAQRRVFCGAAALLCGNSLLFGTLMNIKIGIPPESTLSFSALSRSVYAVHLAASALAGVAMLYLAVCHFMGWAPFEKARWLCLLPVLAVGTKALYIFAMFTPEDSTFVNLLNLVALALLLGFFTQLGRACADAEPPVQQRPMLLYAAGAAAVGLVSSLPNLFCLLANVPCVHSADTAHLISVAGLSFYALAAAMGMGQRYVFRRLRRPVYTQGQKVHDFAQENGQNE